MCFCLTKTDVGRSRKVGVRALPICAPDRQRNGGDARVYVYANYLAIT